MNRPEDDDMEACEARNEFGKPLLYANTGAAVHSTIDQSTNKSLPWLCLAMLLSGLSLALAWSAHRDADRSERETRMLEYYLLELDARVIAAGIKSADQAISKRLEKEPK